MATAKKFNITTFVEDSAANVVPQKNYNTQSETSPSSINSEQQKNTQEEQTKGQRGRKKSLRTIPRQNGKVVFLEVEADAAIARISVLQRVDKQDIIRTALDEFLKKHYDGSDLDTEGSQLLTQYIQKTTQME